MGAQSGLSKDPEPSVRQDAEQELPARQSHPLPSSSPGPQAAGLLVTALLGLPGLPPAPFVGHPFHFQSLTNTSLPPLQQNTGSSRLPTHFPGNPQILGRTT